MIAKPYAGKKLHADQPRKSGSGVFINNGGSTTPAAISYKYTSLSEPGNEWLIEKLDETFDPNMMYWEKAINHYLATGEMSRK